MILYRFKKQLKYSETLERMQKTAKNIAEKADQEQLWFLEHNSVYTAGTSSDINLELLDKNTPVINSGRGGKITWHGPGQRVVYLMINIRERNIPPRDYIHMLEEWIIKALAMCNIECVRREKMIGVWIKDNLAKIAAIGVRVSKGIAFHGIAINVAVNLDKFKAIIPCGISDDQGSVTSLDLEVKVNPQQNPAILLNKNDKYQLMEKLDKALIATFPQVFQENLEEK